MDLGLKGKVALITGSSKGIGLATAMSLADEGCHVILNARHADELQSAADLVRQKGVEAEAVVADVLDPALASRIVDCGIARFGRLDILVNNVGAMTGGTRVLDTTDDDWHAAMEANVVQVARTMRAAVPRMRENGGGAIINITSISGWVPQLVRHGQYGASKAALIYSTERWAMEFIPYNIRVNAVSPGSVLCDGNGWDRYRGRDPEGFKEYERIGFPMGRLGRPEEVAHVVAFLSSPKAYWINGRHIAVDGLEQPFDRPGRAPY